MTASAVSGDKEWTLLGYFGSAGMPVQHLANLCSQGRDLVKVENSSPDNQSPITDNFFLITDNLEYP
jgi:hypothetical protein